MRELVGARVRIVNASRGTCLARQASVASGFWSRACGLLGRPPLEPGEGLVLYPCRAVHTLGMKYSLDAVHVDGTGRVCRLVERMPPYRLGPVVKDSRYVIELPAGTITGTGTAAGDEIQILPE